MNKDECYCGRGQSYCDMIACDNCLQWFHYTCVNLNEKRVKELKVFYCNECKILNLSDENNSMKESIERLENDGNICKVNFEMLKLEHEKVKQNNLELLKELNLIKNKNVFDCVELEKIKNEYLYIKDFSSKLQEQHEALQSTCHQLKIQKQKFWSNFLDEQNKRKELELQLKNFEINSELAIKNSIYSSQVKALEETIANINFKLKNSFETQQQKDSLIKKLNSEIDVLKKQNTEYLEFNSKKKDDEFKLSYRYKELEKKYIQLENQFNFLSISYNDLINTVNITENMF